MGLIALTLFAIPGVIIGQSGQGERAREANRKDTNVFVREAQAGEAAGLAPWEIADRLVGGAFATQQDSERVILENIRAGDEIAFSNAPGTVQMDQAVAYYRQALATAEQQRPPHRPDNMAKCRYRLACGLRQRGLTQYWGVAPRQADLNEAKALFESIVTDFPTSREAPHGYVHRGRIEIDLLGPPQSVTPAEAMAARARSDAIYERLRMDYPDYRLWNEAAITGTNHAAPAEATTDDEVVYYLKNRAWARSIGGSVEDYVRSIQPTIDGGLIVAGVAYVDDPGSGQFWVIKLDADGNPIWQRGVGGGATNASAAALHPTSDGGFVVVGTTWSYGAGGCDGWIVKLDRKGQIAWQRAYGGGGNDGLAAVKETKEGDIVVSGVTRSFGAGYWDVWVMKLKADGSIIWQKTFGGPGSDSSTGLAITSDGGYVVAGVTESFNGGRYGLGRTWILKLNPDGTIAWQKTYNGRGSGDLAGNVQATSDGGCVIAGDTNGYGAGANDTWVLKLNPDGTIAWQKAYGGVAEDGPYGIVQTGDGGFALTGYTRSFGAGAGDLWVLKLKDDGTIAWQKTYGGASNDQGTSIYADRDGGYCVAGITGSFAAGNDDGWILRLNPDGSSVPIGAAPAPGIGQDSSARTVDTDAQAVDTNAVGQDAGATVTNTSAIAADTVTTISQQAPLTWSPARR